MSSLSGSISLSSFTGTDDILPLEHTSIPNMIAKCKEGTSQRAARKTESNADAAGLQQSVSSTPESKEEESQETEVE
ncbi:hypothetical protein CRG98_044412 [Punica granatum]|uniref:Uncharacterized protein n=1 Tax=Punica granatum TaxID=22663 RepID=A0A2I0HVE7_PUNGR|nr:hypothetical protein CRG98_044412 [Punica granatum]